MQAIKILVLGTICLLTYGGTNRLASGQQRQHFRSQPTDQDVIEGSVAIIRCEVGNQAGRVQWAKDGFVLGFNRSIPGYPRYEMIGDHSEGEHHLRIQNASLNDDADYQCQVGPAEGHLPIRATGHLNVLMAPTNIQILGRGRESEIEVTEGEEVTLECLVENAKPVAQVTWYKNNVMIKIDSRKDLLQEASLHRRHNLLSTITIRLTADDDGSHYGCHAQHPALPVEMKASVKISVLYPPGPPVITGYTEGETIRADEERTLTCRSRGGNPLGKVVWYRNNENIDSSDRTVGSESINDHKFIVDSSDNGVVFTCEVRNKLTVSPLLASIKLNVQFPPDKVIVTGPAETRVGENITLTCVAENSNPPAVISWVVDGQPKAQAHVRTEKAGDGGYLTVSRMTMQVPVVERDMMFTCHATNQALGQTKVDTFNLPVLRPPQAPVLHGYSEGVGIREGNHQRITCVSMGGNPPAHLQWYRNGQKIPSQKHSIDNMSTAEITILAEPEDNGAQYRCEAHNSAASTPVSVSTTLVVYFPPSYVKISVHPRNLKAAMSTTLTCEAGPSNPPAVISWLRGGEEKLAGRMTETTSTPNGGMRVTNVLLINVTADDDGQMYTCQASNLALQKDVRKSETLRVLYPPQFLSPPPDVVDVVVGESQVLNLTAKANPGPVEYIWTRHGLPLPNPVIDESWRNAYTHDPSMGVDVVGGMSKVAAYGPLLYIRGVTIQDAGDYELEASNREGSTMAKVLLNVQYAPRIDYTSQTVLVSEGEEARLECTVEGNPISESMMEWEREDFDFTGTKQLFEKKLATLVIRRATRNDTGHFTCMASNGIGRPARANVTLVVRSKPWVVRSEILSRAAADLGSTGTLQCYAEGAPDVQFTWRKDGVALTSGNRSDKYSNQTSQTGLVEWSSNFYIHDVSEKDYGSYDCVADNELGSSVVSVRFTAPTPPDPPLALKVVNTTHDSVVLKCVPGFDGGKPQYFRLRYKTKDSNSYDHLDIYETGVYVFTVGGLSLGTEYYFSIMSFNEVGKSDYRGEFVRATTLSTPAGDDPTLLLNQVLGSKGNLPMLIIIVVVVVGTIIVILNIALVFCVVRKKRGKKREDGSDQASSKSTTNTMYAPSSYNDTVVGETLSSISEKSRESYTQEDSVMDYEAGICYGTGGLLSEPPDLLFGYEQTHKHAASTYLIDQIEPPPEYASQTPSQPSSANYDPHEDDYAEVLRRNAYNHQLGSRTPRPPSRATHYSTSPEARGYMSFSYTPSPTVPNGAAQYHSGGYPAGHPSAHPSVTLGLHDHIHGFQHSTPLGAGESLSMVVDDVGSNGSNGVNVTEGCNDGGGGGGGGGVGGSVHSLGLDSNPPASLGLEQHSIPSEHPSLTLDPHSITIDHPVISVTDFSNRNGDLRVQPPTSTQHHPLSTFNPNPSPSSYSGSDLEGHLV
ncbi:nephrin-like isoform X4 [Oratosquilla oratoria]|uniref:nephrin-like isoform X4 n=1 Tax=Oratosquilla oratoria TaxID=337810 RepID=UPI003F776B35